MARGVEGGEERDGFGSNSGDGAEDQVEVPDL